MEQSYKFLRASVLVFRVLAWLSLALQVGTGVVLVVTGGEPVFIGGVDVPARIVGILNFVAGGIYFFAFWFLSKLVQLLLDIRKRFPDQ